MISIDQQIDQTTCSSAYEWQSQPAEQTSSQRMTPQYTSLVWNEGSKALASVHPLCPHQADATVAAC